MLMNRSNNLADKTRLIVVTADPAFEESARATFNASVQIDLQVVKGRLPEVAESLNVEGITVLVVDLDASQEDEMKALQAFISAHGARPPIVVVTQSFEADVARRLLQMRVADFLVKPVPPI